MDYVIFGIVFVIGCSIAWAVGVRQGAAYAARAIVEGI
ncbi:hypothetical protein UFOVP132_23 [uncultured Caudovirales phage]|uniref:Uncharacterized protein n=1 Tax=uncultured Caudovirales phage TaxID=2100421 RepID=A0A6J5L8P6_9CAUD|nr:hypothetical protein UFOVP132_23 [uncultured Caudovirales phage]